MIEKNAKRVLNEILKICKENNIHCEVSSIFKPELAFIKIKEISIKIDKEK